MVGAKGANFGYSSLCRKMHMRAPEQLKMFLKNSPTTADILDKSHDVMLKLHKNRKQT